MRAVKIGITTMAAMLLMLGQVQAGIVTYSDRASFDAVAPGVPTEGFQNANSIVTEAIYGEVNSATNSSLFSPNDILPGINFTDSTPGSVRLFLAGPGHNSNPTLALGSNYPKTDTLVLEFAPGVNAIAFDLFQNFGIGKQSGVDKSYSIELFDMSNGSLGVYTTVVPSGAAGFFGVTTDQGLFGSLTIDVPDGYEVVDNVSFGQIQLTPTPEPGSLALFGIGALGMAFVGRRRRKAKVV